MVSFMPRPSHPLNRMPPGLRSTPGSFREETNLFPLPGLELRIVQHVARTDCTVPAPIIINVGLDSVVGIATR